MTTDKSIFKAYDIRGKYPAEINERIVSEIVGKLGKFFRAGEIIIAHDSRLSSPVLYRAVVEALDTESYRLKPVAVGLATTPMFYFLVKKMKAGGGIMITASHNPKNYNGLKVVDERAMPVSGLQILKFLMSKS